MVVGPGPFSASSAPLIVGDLVISGMAGGDGPLRGYLSAYKATTGQLAWRFWTILAFALAVLGLNKQLDLQSFLTAFARGLANSEGWYDRRREFQKLFVVTISLFALFGAATTLVLLRKSSWQIRAAAAGFVLLGAFICVRAASFHHVDRILNSGILGARFNWIIELGGISLVAVSAFGAARTPRRNPSSVRNSN